MNLSIFLHLGTSIASLLYFFRDLYEDMKGERTLLKWLLIATSITILTVLPLYRASRAAASMGLFFQFLIGVSLISTGLLMSKAKGRGERRAISPWEVAALGLVQGLAVIPGVSRSGITLTYLLLRGVDPSEAFRLAYMLGIPLGLAAPLGLWLVGDVPSLSSSTLLALLSTLVVAILTISLLLKAARGRRLWALCLLLGVVTILTTAIYAW